MRLTPAKHSSPEHFLVWRPWFTLTVAALGILTFIGCRQLSHLNGEPGAPCAADAECADGLICETEGFPGGYCTRTNCESVDCPGSFGSCIFINRASNTSACIESCNSNADCIRAGYICADLDGGDKGCFPEANSTGTAGAVGSSCNTDAQCTADLTCLTSFVFGYCTRPCTGNGDCGGDICADIGGGTMRCMAACDNNNQCRFGYSCRDDGFGGVCSPDEGGTAVRNPEGALDGDPCTSDLQCRGGTCITGADFPNGYCTTRDCDSVGCASADSTCVATQSGAFCYDNCGSSADCRDGYRCTSLENGGNVCYALSPISTPDAATDGPIPVACDAQTVSGNTRAVNFTLASGTQAFTMTPFSPSGSEVIPVSLALPDGRNIDFETDYAFQTINSLLLATIVPTMFPASPRFDDFIMDGQYTFTYETDDANSCYSLVEQPATGTTLDVNFYLVGVPGVSAANAPSDPNVTAMIDEFRTIYTNAGITIDDIRFFDVSGTDLDNYRIIRSFNDIYRLIGISESPGETLDDALSINVFLIEGFAIRDIPGLLGLSAGIPGAPGLHGNGAAGLVFTSENLAGEPRSLGQTMGHEVGHFLGLRHTSERGGSEFDPIDDTQQCNSPENPFNCPDVENLMFPFSVDGVTQRTVSGDQRYVLQRNPLVK